MAIFQEWGSNKISRQNKGTRQYQDNNMKSVKPEENFTAELKRPIFTAF